MPHKLYDILGVPLGSSKDDIKKAYRKLAMKMHPDKGGDPDKFKEVSHAYDVLSDDQQRQNYDQFGDDGPQVGHGPSPHDFANIFEGFFGGGGGPFGGNPFGGNPFEMFNHGRSRQNKQVVHNMKLSLKEAYTGTKRTIKITSEKACDSCKKSCSRCEGTGVRKEVRNMGFMTQVLSSMCDTCHGEGFAASGCNSCSQSGKSKTEKVLNVEVPAGVAHGTTLAVGNEFVLVVEIQNDNTYIRDGDNLIHKANIPFVDSMVGKIITIDHFGTQLSIDTSLWGIVRPDKRYHIQGKGMPKQNGGNGELIIEFDIAYPSSLTESQKVKLREVFEENV